MKKYLSLFFLVLMVSMTTLAADGPRKITLNASKTEFVVKATEGNSFRFRNQLSTIQLMEVNSKSGEFVKLACEGYVSTKDFGSPELPLLSKLVEIPIGSEIAIEVISYTEEIINLGELGINKLVFPAQPSLSKSEQPEDVPFHFSASLYEQNKYLENAVAVIDHLGTMRGVQMGRLRIHPVQYNPVTNQLRVLNNLEVEVTFHKGDYAATKTEKNKYYSPAFEKNLSQMINYTPSINKELIQIAPLKYVIVADQMFQTTLQPFIQWKIKKGFNVVEAYTNDPAVGNTTTSIKAYLQNEYTSATAQDPAPSYILFVGDIAQVPAFSGTAGSHVSDLYYCTYDGTNDIYPEVYYGRFSATNPEELQTQIDKTLEYEQYLMPSDAFLGECVMVAGVDASMAATHGNGQINYGTDNYFNLAHGLTSHTYLYGSGSPITSNSSGASAAIIANISAGVGFANYTAHCSASGWADPSFTTSDVSGLNNAHEYPLMIGNCCSSVEYQQSECFGEAVLRAENKGAIGYIGGSNSTYWDEDYWWGVGSGTVSANPTYTASGLGAYDKLWHDNGEAIADWYVANGQIVQAGNLAVTAAGGSETYYWEIYHLMGDPSVMTYLGVPPALSCAHYAAVPLGTNTLTVTTEEHAYVALSQNGILLDAGIADATGTVVLNFTALSTIGTCDIVATKQNRKPYIETIDVIVANAPFVVYNSHSIDDVLFNNNGAADFSENVMLDVTLNNLGTVDAQNVYATLSSTDTCITIVQDSAQYGTIAASASMAMNAAFELSIADLVSDQHTVPFTLDVSNGTDAWTSTLNITLNSPKLMVKLIDYSDELGGNNNHRFEAGEVIFASFEVLNEGHVKSSEAFLELSSTSQYLTILADSFALGQLDVNVPDTIETTIVIDPATPLAELVSIDANLMAGLYTSNKTVEKEVGLVAEDWESNTFTSYDWGNNSSVPWTLTSGSYEGNFAAKSGAIGNSATTVLQITIDVASADTLSFYKKVSCEEPGWSVYDYLEFSIDGSSQDQWAGEVDWSQEKYPLSTGQHTLKWAYVKDSYATGGSDCAWIDLIEFPELNGMSSNNAPEFTSIDSTTATKGTPYEYTLLTYDADADPVGINAVSLPTWLSFTDNGDGTGTLTGTPTGADIYTHQVIVSANDGSAYTPHIFNIEVKAIVGMEKIDNANGWSIFPNPTRGTANVTIELEQQETVSLELYNALGKHIEALLTNASLSAGNHTIAIDLSSYDAGIYYCRFSTGENLKTEKIIITK